MKSIESNDTDLKNFDSYDVTMKLRSSHQSERLAALSELAKALGINEEPEPTPPNGGKKTGITREPAPKEQTSTKGRGRARPSSITGYLARRPIME